MTRQWQTEGILLRERLRSDTLVHETVMEHNLNEITIGKRHSIESEALGEERAYWVSLPTSYNSTTAPQDYPVLYLLDGDSHFHYASGGGTSFLRFIRDELFPQIESAYRTLPHRILVGHSFGGLLALSALLDAPEMFQSYIAIDPSLWWDDQMLVHRMEREFRAAQERRGSVYLSLANNPDIGNGDPTVPARAFSKSLESAATPEFRSSLQYFDSEDHGSVPLLSLYHGLCFAFEGYKPPIEECVGQPPALTAHFERVSDRLGMVLRPPRRLVGGLGHYALLHGDVDTAIEFFNLNLSFHPGLFKMYDLLGEAYMVKGEKALAIENYERSIEINPHNENARKRLGVLKSKELG
jgi:predicted alpha/beta superfamily hydrolase